MFFQGGSVQADGSQSEAAQGEVHGLSQDAQERIREGKISSLGFKLLRCFAVSVVSPPSWLVCRRAVGGCKR